MKDQQISNLTSINRINESILEGKDKEIIKYKRQTTALKIGGCVVVVGLLTWLLIK